MLKDMVLSILGREKRKMDAGFGKTEENAAVNTDGNISANAPGSSDGNTAWETDGSAVEGLETGKAGGGAGDSLREAAGSSEREEGEERKERGPGNGFISGELISRKLNVTRSAVNAAVRQLRNDGYVISSVTNRGYRLESSPDHLTEGSMMIYLPDERMEKVTVLDTADSTNSTLRQLSFSGAPEGSVVIANEQTMGRGRRGRNFVSMKDKGIYLSYLLRPAADAGNVVNITAWTAAAVFKAVEETCGVSPGIKWVNDLVLNGRKICGILTEMVVEGESGSIDSLIVGIGINVNNTGEDFPEELSSIATSILRETGRKCSRAKLASSIIGHMDRMYASWPSNKEEYLKIYREADITCSRDILVCGRDGDIPARSLYIDEDFRLVVRYGDGRIESLSSGEVSIRGIYGKV